MAYARMKVVALSLLMMIGATGCASGLKDAVRSQDPAKVRSLLDAKADPNSRDEDGRTPLHVAMEYGSVEITRMLIAAKADVNATGKEGETPLLMAVHNRGEEMVRELLAAGANPNPKPSSSAWGSTPLTVAMDQPYLSQNNKVVQLLIDYGATPGEAFDSCVQMAVAEKAPNILARLLNQPGVTADQKAKALAAGLSTALSKNYDPENISQLLDMGADPRKVTFARPHQESSFSAEPGQGMTYTVRTYMPSQEPAIFSPVEHDDAATLEKLLAKGCDVNVKDSNGRTIAEIAERDGRKHVLALIRDRVAK